MSTLSLLAAPKVQYPGAASHDNGFSIIEKFGDLSISVIRFPSSENNSN